MEIQGGNGSKRHEKAGLKDVESYMCDKFPPAASCNCHCTGISSSR